MLLAQPAGEYGSAARMSSLDSIARVRITSTWIIISAVLERVWERPRLTGDVVWVQTHGYAARYAERKPGLQDSVRCQPQRRLDWRPQFHSTPGWEDGRSRALTRR